MPPKSDINSGIFETGYEFRYLRDRVWVYVPPRSGISKLRYEFEYRESQSTVGVLCSKESQNSRIWLYGFLCFRVFFSKGIYKFKNLRASVSYSSKISQFLNFWTRTFLTFAILFLNVSKWTLFGLRYFIEIITYKVKW